MDIKTIKIREEQTAVLWVEVLCGSFRTVIGVEMQADLGFELEQVAVCATLENTVLLGLCIRIKEQEKLFVQKPEHKPGKEAPL